MSDEKCQLTSNEVVARLRAHTEKEWNGYRFLMRDAADEIERLTRELAKARGKLRDDWNRFMDALRAEVGRHLNADETFDRKRFEKAPCYICGYNGAGYYQPGLHRCAAQYHGYKLPIEQVSSDPLANNVDELEYRRQEMTTMGDEIRFQRAEIERLTRERQEWQDAAEKKGVAWFSKAEECDRLRAALEALYECQVSSESTEERRPKVSAAMRLAREALRPADETRLAGALEFLPDETAECKHEWRPTLAENATHAFRCRKCGEFKRRAPNETK
jgi:hypothetical protein